MQTRSAVKNPSDGMVARKTGRAVRASTTNMRGAKTKDTEPQGNGGATSLNTALAAPHDAADEIQALRAENDRLRNELDAANKREAAFKASLEFHPGVFDDVAEPAPAPPPLAPLPTRVGKKRGASPTDSSEQGDKKQLHAQAQKKYRQNVKDILVTMPEYIKELQDKATGCCILFDEEPIPVLSQPPSTLKGGARRKFTDTAKTAHETALCDWYAKTCDNLQAAILNDMKGYTKMNAKQQRAVDDFWVNRGEMWAEQEEMILRGK